MCLKGFLSFNEIAMGATTFSHFRSWFIFFLLVFCIAPLSWHGRPLNIVAAVASGPRSTVCSSSGGPYCLQVNGLPQPNYFPKASKRANKEAAKTTRVLLSDALKEWTSGMVGSAQQTTKQGSFDQGLAGLQGDEGKDKPKTTGSYAVSGAQNDANIVLSPTRWIERPSAMWSSLGVTGEITSIDDFTLTLELTDKGYSVETCTSLVARLDMSSLTAEDMREAQKTGYLPHGGRWTGKYTCGGVDTDLVLTLNHRKMSGDSMVLDGTFEFTFDSKHLKPFTLFTVDTEDLKVDHLSKRVSEQVETLMTEIIKELDRVSEQLDVDQTQKYSSREAQDTEDGVRQALGEPSATNDLEETEYEQEEYAYGEEEEEDVEGGFDDEYAEEDEEEVNEEELEEYEEA